MARSIETLNESQLTSYLEAHVTGFQGPIVVSKFPGGQSNPTYLLDAESGKYVLRRKPPGKLLKSAHAVDREFRVIKALAGTDVPVAPAVHLCEDDDVIGSMFYIMGFVDGRVLWDPTLPELPKEKRRPLNEELIRVLAAMHELDVDAVGLTDYGKPGNYFERQIGVWTRQYRAAETSRVEPMETLLSWLPGNLPPDEAKVSLIHGDYRLDNVMFDHHAERAIAVLDWELSTLGNPIADLAYYCMCLRLPKAGRIHGLAGLDRESLGLPTEQQIVDLYCQLRGLSGIEHWPFYLAFSFFRLAAICQGVYRRSLDGNASSDKASQYGAVVEPLAAAGAGLI